MIPKLYSAAEIAEAWNVSEDFVLKNVPSVKRGGLRRFPEADVLAYWEQNSEGELAEVHELRGVSG